MRQRTVLGITLGILLLILGVLIYLYVTLIRPPGPVISPDVVGVEHLFSIYGYGDKPSEQLKRPTGVAVDKDENIYITDTDHHRVLVFDKRGKFLFRFGKKGDRPGELKFPLGIAVAPGGNIYVCDKVQSKIVIYNSKGKLIKEIREMMPLNLVVFRGKLYGVTYGHVVVYDLQGNQISKWGRQGRAPGDFDFPGGIAVGKDNDVYVADSNNTRLQAFDKNGEVLWITGRPPKSLNEPNRQFGLPDGLAIDDKGRLFVIDAFRGTIQIYSDKGKKLAEIGEWGHAEGKLHYPAGIVYSGERKFCIADKFNSRVQVMRLSVTRRKKKE